MPTLTVRNLEEDAVRRLRIRAATAAKLAEFRRRTAERGSASSEALLAASRDRSRDA